MQYRRKPYKTTKPSTNTHSTCLKKPSPKETQPVPIEVIEENQHAAQIRLKCDTCGCYIGTRMILQTELAAKKQAVLLCSKCRQNQSRN